MGQDQATTATTPAQTFAEAVAAHQQADATAKAAQAKLGALEAAGDWTSPQHAEAEAEETDKSDAEANAWVALMATPAPDLTAVLVKLAALEAYPGGEPLALPRVMEDLRRLAATLAPAVDPADAELVALAAEAEALIPKVDGSRRYAAEACGEAHAAADAELAGLGRAPTAEERLAAYAAHEANGAADAAERRADELEGRLNDLARRACALQASSLAGLRAKFVFAARWFEPDEDAPEVASAVIDACAVLQVG